MKRCPHCKIEMRESDFSPNRANPSGLSSWCRVCNKEHARKYRKTSKRPSQSVKKWATANKETLIRARKSWNQRNPDKHRVHQYRAMSKLRGHSFELDSRLVMDLVTDFCFYCGVPPSPVHGIDRVDNAKGYIFGNVVTCCRRCNTAKSDLSPQEFREWVDRIYGWMHREPDASVSVVVEKVVK